MNLVMTILIVIAIICSTQLITNILQGKKFPKDLNYLQRRVETSITLFGYIIATFIICSYFKIDLTGFFVTIGAGSIVIAFAAKELIENFLAGIIIAIQSPFQNNDKVTISGICAVVEKITPRYVHLKDSKGKTILIPNSIILKSILIVEKHVKKISTNTKKGSTTSKK